MRDPGSVWAPLPEAGEPDGYTKTQFIVHSTGDTASADRIRRYFAQAGVQVESTFIVGRDASDPTLQVMDSTDNADANVKSNQRGISVEVVGTGNEPFTEWQVREIIRLGRWAANTHPIERRICPAYDQSGFGWHVMFGAPGPWTTVRGKVCPGAVRIGQLVDRIFPAIFDPSEDDLPTPDDVWNHVLVMPDKSKAAARTVLTSVRQSQKSQQSDLDDLQSRVARLEESVKDLATLDVDALAAALAARLKA